MVGCIYVGGGPSLELVTPLPAYFLQFQNFVIAVAAHIVNSFGKTVRANQSDLDVFQVQDGDGIGLRIADYDSHTGRLEIFLRFEIPEDFGGYVEIFLDDGRSSTNITISPVYAGTDQAQRHTPSHSHNYVQ